MSIQTLTIAYINTQTRNAFLRALSVAIKGQSLTLIYINTRYKLACKTLVANENRVL